MEVDGGRKKKREGGGRREEGRREEGRGGSLSPYGRAALRVARLHHRRISAL